MDLTVNGPLKAAIRRARCKALFFYFQGWRLKHALAQLGVPEGQRDSVPLPAYQPPMPTLEDGLRTLFATLNERFTTPEIALEALRVFLETPFDGGRHADRVAKLADLDQTHGTVAP